MFSSGVTVNQSQENLDPLFWGEAAICLAVGRVRVFVAAKNAPYFVHDPALLD